MDWTTRVDGIVLCSCEQRPAVFNEKTQLYELCDVCKHNTLIRGVELTIESRMKGIGIPPRYLNAKLSDFDTDFIQDLKLNEGMLIIGAVDTGKTHLLAAVARRHLLVTHRCYWMKAPKFFSEARDGLRTGTDLIKKVCEVPYLFIDDLGAERLTDWVFETWYRILDYRYENQLHMAITLNEVDVLDERLFRRLRDSTNLVEKLDKRC